MTNSNKNGNKHVFATAVLAVSLIGSVLVVGKYIGAEETRNDGQDHTLKRHEELWKTSDERQRRLETINSATQNELINIRRSIDGLGKKLDRNYREQRNRSND